MTRRLSSDASLITRTPELAEVYQEGERFWLVDDRWGVCELNLLKGSWRSWVIADPRLDPFRCMEMAVLWPMAQLLRSRGVHLTPAASVVRDGLGTLLISPFGLEPELAALLHAGYQIVGQRWTALREENDDLWLLHIPGRVERQAAPHLRRDAHTSGSWIDLAEGRPGATAWRAVCHAVLIAEHGRRPRAHLREVNAPGAAKLLRRSWPIAELHPQRRHGQLTSRIARECRCGEVQLSRDPRDLLALMRSLSVPLVAVA